MGNSSTQDIPGLRRVVHSAKETSRTTLPNLQEIYKRCWRTRRDPERSQYLHCCLQGGVTTACTEDEEEHLSSGHPHPQQTLHYYTHSFAHTIFIDCFCLSRAGAQTNLLHIVLCMNPRLGIFSAEHLCSIHVFSAKKEATQKISSEYTDFKTVGPGLLPEVHAHCPLLLREGLYMPRVKFHCASVNVTATCL